MRKEERKTWRACSTCHQLYFGSRHVCPEMIRVKADAELDMILDEELSTWNQDIRKFWNSNDIKFYEWLVENNRY